MSPKPRESPGLIGRKVCSLLCEEAFADFLVDRDIRAAEEGVGLARRILRDQRQGAGAAGLGFRAGFEIELGEPGVGELGGGGVAIMLGGVGGGGGVPIFRG